jgi:hypothetical protein
MVSVGGWAGNGNAADFSTLISYYNAAGGAPPTYLEDCLLDDNAASTVVSNDGSNSDWVSSRNTSLLTSAQAHGSCNSASFYFDTADDNAIGADNITSEQLQVIFYIRFDNATAAARELLWGIGDADDTTETNEIYIKRDISTDELRICVQGNTGATECDSSSDFNPSADTWYKITVNIDASTTPWTISVLRDATTLTWDDPSPWGSSELAVFASPPHIGSADAHDPDIYICGVTIEDTTP